MEEEKSKQEKASRRISFIILGISFIIIVAGVIMLLTNSGSKTNSNSGSDDPQKQNEVVIDGFTYSFLKLETNNNNLVYSPLSIKYALSMLDEGAAGKTKEEIDKLISNIGLTKYENIDKVLSLANSVFIRDTFKESVKEEYINTLSQKYNAEVIYDKFENAQSVNKWIEDKTFNLIKNMLKDEQVQSEDVEMLLVNALAIDMAWNIEFVPENTTSRPFTKANGEEINVAMMHMSTTSTNLKYYKDGEYTELAMPFKDYNGTELEFVAIMPESDLNKMLTSDVLTTNVNNILDKLHTVDKEELSISLPRFDFEYKVSLKNDLNTLGVETAFSPDADFSNISAKPLNVDDVLHKATIKCTEKGVKAAAATVIIMKDNAAIMDPEEKQIIYLNFNKPFMFVVRDSKTKEVWFTGTVYEPQLWESVKGDYNYE